MESVPAPLSRMWRVFKQNKYFSVMILKGISTTFSFYDHSANWKFVKIIFFLQIIIIIIIIIVIIIVIIICMFY